MSIVKVFQKRLEEVSLVRGVDRKSIAAWAGTNTGENSSVDSLELFSQRALLAEKLEIPVEFFAAEFRTPSMGVVRHRSRSALSACARSAAEVKLKWLHLLHEELARGIVFPEVTVPKLELPREFLSIGDGQIEALALEARAQAGVEEELAIDDMVQLLERMGVIVARVELGAAELESVSAWIEGRPYVLLNSCRTRFLSKVDAAHALAHLILGPSYGDFTGKMHGAFERVAHLFASAFLLPENPLSEDLVSIGYDALLELKASWRVPMVLVLERARHLGWISRKQFDGGMRTLARKRRQGEEQGDLEAPPEAPTLLREALMTMLVGERGWDVCDVLEGLPLASSDIEELLASESDSLKRGRPLQVSEVGELIQLFDQSQAVSRPEI